MIQNIFLTIFLPFCKVLKNHHQCVATGATGAGTGATGARTGAAPVGPLAQTGAENSPYSGLKKVGGGGSGSSKKY